MNKDFIPLMLMLHAHYSVFVASYKIVLLFYTENRN